jgi:predicted short-subunit dehydrogenase-like oxidoreductase (DUF2520 family)
VGTSLAFWLTDLGAPLAWVAGRGPLRFPLPGATPRRSIDQAENDGLDLLLLAVGDPALEEVAVRLAERRQAPVVLHVSGHHDAEVLAPLRRGGSAVGSLHPLRAFARPCPALREAPGLCFAVDGDAEALALARRIATACGAPSYEIAGDRRRIYHLAASWAAGAVMTVLAAAEEAMQAGSLPRELRSAYLALTTSALAQVDPELPLAAAITGPAARGDRETLDRQRAALGRHDISLLPFFDALRAETERQRRRLEAAPSGLQAGSPELRQTR